MLHQERSIGWAEQAADGIAQQQCLIHRHQLMVFDLLAGPRHGHRIKSKTGSAQDKQGWPHRHAAQHGATPEDHHQHLHSQYRQTPEAIRQTANRPLPQNAGTHHHRHPVADLSIAHPLMIEVERHQTIERPQHDAGDDAAIDPEPRLTQPQHRPDPGAPLLLIALTDDAGEQQRQNRRQYQSGRPGQHVHQAGRQLADQQLPEHGSQVIDHHVSGQQSPPILRVAAAHQRALHHHPDHGAADAGNESPGEPAPETEGNAEPDTTCGKDNGGEVVAAVEAKALDQGARQQGSQQIPAEIGGADHTYLPGRQIVMGQPERHQSIEHRDGEGQQQQATEQ